MVIRIAVALLIVSSGARDHPRLDFPTDGGRRVAGHWGLFALVRDSRAQQHPNIVQVYDVGEVDGLPYFSLEFLEGGTLGDRLSGTPMLSRQAAELLATLAGAIHGVHLAGIAHRDLKPANILFDTEGIP